MTEQEQALCDAYRDYNRKVRDLEVNADKIVPIEVGGESEKRRAWRIEHERLHALVRDAGHVVVVTGIALGTEED